MDNYQKKQYCLSGGYWIQCHHLKGGMENAGGG